MKRRQWIQAVVILGVLLVGSLWLLAPFSRCVMLREDTSVRDMYDRFARQYPLEGYIPTGFSFTYYANTHQLSYVMMTFRRVRNEVNEGVNIRLSAPVYGSDCYETSMGEGNFDEFSIADPQMAAHFKEQFLQVSSHPYAMIQHYSTRYPDSPQQDYRLMFDEDLGKYLWYIEYFHGTPSGQLKNITYIIMDAETGERLRDIEERMNRWWSHYDAEHNSANQ